MTKKSIGLLALVASLFAAGILLAQSGAPKFDVTTASAPKQQKLVRVCTLNTIEANQEFQANVQLMQAQRQQAIELNSAMEKETAADKKKEMKAKLDELMAKLNENNQKMIKAYGFSLDRSYTMVIEKAHVYMAVTDEEAAKIEKEQADKK
ncbi:MAG: hypothetical protein PHQ04_00390 [Opitutaceae bacterium]|nr:hypothetical protein [Opitutaceae bacterium]